MIWNNAFWGFFLLTETVLICLILIDFRIAGTAATLVLMLGVWKLAEDYRMEKKRAPAEAPRVRRDILKKLKQAA